MRNSRIDGKGLLPFMCPHRQGYNSTSMCFQCAEHRAAELESLIAMMGQTMKSAIRNIDGDERSYQAIKNSLGLALDAGRRYFDNRPNAQPTERDLGDWLSD